MGDLIVYMLETMVCSAVLMLFYGLLLNRKVPFAVCRAYLLAAAVVAAVIPLLRIPVWHAAPEALAAEITAGEVSLAVVAGAGGIGMRDAVLAVYSAGVIVSLAVTAVQLCRIWDMARRGETVRDRAPRIVRTAERISSFSFFGTIYLSREIAEADMAAIVTHENSHVRHKHSAEKVAMQLLRALMWWNPFVWIAQRRLSEVHEYEADADVLDEGYDVNDYIASILKNLLGYSPDIANSFRDSLTKKRFKMMITKRRSRYALLRTLAVLPVLAALLCTFSFTAKAVEPVNVGHAAVKNVSGEPVAGVAAQDEDEVYMKAETKPRFQNGDENNFRNWVMAHINYPDETLKSGKTGRVIVKFIVEKDGSIGDVSLLETFDKAAGEESIRVVESSPKWSAGMVKGKAVRVQYIMPINFLRGPRK